MNDPLLNARALIDQAIQHLNELKEKITENNARFFSIKLEKRRKLDPIYFYGQAVGFQQAGPEMLEILVEDSRKEGHPL